MEIAQRLAGTLALPKIIKESMAFAFARR